MLVLGATIPYTMHRVGQNSIHTPYDRLFGDFPATISTVCIHRVYIVLANPKHGITIWHDYTQAYL